MGVRAELQELLDAEQQFEEMLGRPLMQYSHEARAVRDRLDAAVAAAREALKCDKLQELEERIVALEARVYADDDRISDV